MEQTLREFAKSGSESEQIDRKILQTISGVGVVASEVTQAELADARRFSSLKKVVAYAGLAPGQRESAGKRKSLHIEKTGSPLPRWVLNEFCISSSPFDTPFQKTIVFSHIERKAGSK